MTYALSSARTTGSIASYIAPVSSQSRARRASSSLFSPLPKRLTFGDIAGLSSIAKQSSIKVVWDRFRRGIRVRRSETTIAIARANSWGDICRITAPLTPTRRVEGTLAVQVNRIHGYRVENYLAVMNAAGMWRPMSDFLVSLAGHFGSASVKSRSSLIADNKTSGAAA